MPGGAVVVDAEVDETAQVDGGGSVGETELVGGDASVADSSVAVGDEPGDGEVFLSSPRNWGVELSQVWGSG